jgi:hypothetical protein
LLGHSETRAGWLDGSQPRAGRGSALVRGVVVSADAAAGRRLMASGNPCAASAVISGAPPRPVAPQTGSTGWELWSHARRELAWRLCALLPLCQLLSFAEGRVSHPAVCLLTGGPPGAVECFGAVGGLTDPGQAEAVPGNPAPLADGGGHPASELVEQRGHAEQAGAVRQVENQPQQVPVDALVITYRDGELAAVEGGAGQAFGGPD